MNRISAAFLALPFVGASIAGASIVTFDSLVEGDIGPSFTDSGITFFNLDHRTTPGFVNFSIQRADATLAGPGVSAPNAQGFGSWVPGPAQPRSRSAAQSCSPPAPSRPMAPSTSSNG